MHALPLFKTLLILTNCAVLSFLIILMTDHVKANYNILSWSSAFHILCIIWLVMRGVFWLLTISSESNWGNATFYTLYWMPHPLQFGAFMLLPLFYAQVVYPAVWRTYWAYIRPWFVLALFAIVAFQTVWAILATIEDKRQADTCDDDFSTAGAGLNKRNASSTMGYNHTHSAPVPVSNDDLGKISVCFHTNYSSDAFRLVASSLFLGLAVIQGVYGYQIAYLERQQYSRFFNAPQEVLNAVNLTLFVSFLSRGLYQLGTVFLIYVLPEIPLQGDEDVSPWVFLSFELWDYIPTILLVLTVTSRSLGTQRAPPKPFPSFLIGGGGSASAGGGTGVGGGGSGDRQRLLGTMGAGGYSGYGGLFDAEAGAVGGEGAGVEMAYLTHPPDPGSLDRFHPPSLTPPNSLLGSYKALGEPGDPSATSPLVEHALQGPGRTQRRRGSSFTDSVVAGLGVQVSSSSGSISGGGGIPPPLQLTSTSGLGAVAAYAASNPPLSSSASSSSPSSSLSSRPGPGALPAPRPQRLAPQVLPALDQPPLQAPRPQRPLSLGPRGQGLGQGQGQGQGLPPRPGQAYLRLSPEPGASDS